MDEGKERGQCNAPSPMLGQKPPSQRHRSRPPSPTPVSVAGLPALPPALLTAARAPRPAHPCPVCERHGSQAGHAVMGQVGHALMGQVGHALMGQVGHALMGIAPGRE
eukprot:356543-Chlamydomonas_euryale.AAC.14